MIRRFWVFLCVIGACNLGVFWGALGFLGFYVGVLCLFGCFWIYAVLLRFCVDFGELVCFGDLCCGTGLFGDSGWVGCFWPLGLRCFGI